MNIPEMYKILPENKLGDCEIDHFEINQKEAELARIRGLYSGDPLSRWIEYGKYARLCIGNSLMMTDCGGVRGIILLM